MGAFAEGRSMYARIRDNPARIASRLAERDRLDEELHGSASVEGLQITSATVNQQSYSGQVAMTKQHRLQVLDVFAQHLAAGGMISSTTTPVFQGLSYSES